MADGNPNPCGSGNPTLDVAVGFYSFLGDPIGTIIKQISLSILSGAISLFGTFTQAISTKPNADPVNAISNELEWLVVVVAIGSVLFACVRMALERRGEAGASVAKGIARLIIVTGGATAIAKGASSLSDRFASYLIDKSAGSIGDLKNILREHDSPDVINVALKHGYA